ncbi:MAG: TrkH family potassium uptake protein [Oscillospiraceae bacterium]
MNIQMVLYITGHILKVVALLMLLPCAVALFYGERCAAAFLITIALTAAIGFGIGRRKPANTVIYAREGFVVVALSWVSMSALGALPFVISGEIPSFIDAFFETVSGFTTTGSSILTNVEIMSRGLLFWRSFTHWIGGMGVLVFVLSVLPLAGGRAMHLMRAEVPGPTVGKLLPRLQSTAKVLYAIYFLMTVVLIVLLFAGGMPLFDSTVHAFGTAGTGGFSIKNSSIGQYHSAYFEWVIGVGMLLFGVNFNVYYYLLLRDLRAACRNEELRCYLAIIGISTAVIAVNVRSLFPTVHEAIRAAFFQVSSIITTTGYATADFNLWPELSRSILVLLMFCGACAGSTGGGIKVSRLMILCRSAVQEIRRMLHPRSVSVIRLEGKPVEEETTHGAYVFLLVYLLIFCGSVLLVSVDNFSAETTFTAVAACLNNIGPGLGMVGATGNFSAFSDFSKLVLSFNMLAGRLEIFPIIMLLTPFAWRKQ